MKNEGEIRFFPIFIAVSVSTILEIIATFVDEIITGHLFADGAFAAVNLIEPLMFFEIFLGGLATYGGLALIIRARGAGDRKKMSEMYSQTLIICGFTAVFLTAIYVLFTSELVRLVADDPAVYDYALAYFKVIRFLPLVDMVYSFLLSYVLCQGGYVQLYISIVFRIGTNAFLSWQLGSWMGLTGIAIASLISIVVAELILSTFLLTKKHGLKFRWFFDIRELFEMAKLGIAESALNVFIVLMELGINTYTLKNYAETGVAAIAVVVDVFEFVIYLSLNVSNYESLAVNDSIGKNSRKSMDRALKVSWRGVVIEGLVLTGLILLVSGVMPGAFDIDNPETARHATQMLIIFAPAPTLVLLSYVTAVFYQYTQRVRRAITLFGMFVMLMPVLLGMLFGQFALEGIAAGIAAGPAVSIALMYGYARVIRKEKLFDYTLLNLKKE